MASTVKAQGAPAAKGGNMVAIITMFFIFAMISFVTNMAAPFGNIWGFRYDWAGMAGNLMNFVAYLFMGIPARNMLIKYGYKKTALIALAVVQSVSAFSFLLAISGLVRQPSTFTFSAHLYAVSVFVCSTQLSTPCSTFSVAAATRATSSFRLAALSTRSRVLSLRFS